LPDYVQDACPVFKEGARIQTDNIDDLAVTEAKVAALAITPAKLSTIANTRIITIPIGTLSATGSFAGFHAPAACAIAAAYLINTTAIAANDIDYWTIALVDKGANGSGSDTIASKTTQATGGAGISAYAEWTLGDLNASHKVLGAGDVVGLTCTKAAAAANLVGAVLQVELTMS
jgi:hypothetical protein